MSAIWVSHTSTPSNYFMRPQKRIFQSTFKNNYQNEKKTHKNGKRLILEDMVTRSRRILLEAQKEGR